MPTHIFNNSSDHAYSEGGFWLDKDTNIICEWYCDVRLNIERLIIEGIGTVDLSEYDDYSDLEMKELLPQLALQAAERSFEVD